VYKKLRRFNVGISRQIQGYLTGKLGISGEKRPGPSSQEVPSRHGGTRVGRIATGIVSRMMNRAGKRLLVKQKGLDFYI
jgi:hypothetical protein